MATHIVEKRVIASDAMSTRSSGERGGPRDILQIQSSHVATA